MQRNILSDANDFLVASFVLRLFCEWMQTAPPEHLRAAVESHTKRDALALVICREYLQFLDKKADLADELALGDHYQDEDVDDEDSQLDRLVAQSPVIQDSHVAQDAPCSEV